MRAVHFGAGNIGRGFIGLLLHEAGCEVVFADVNSELIAALRAAESYRVIEVGEGTRTRVVTRFRAVDSAAEPEALAAELAEANIVTTAVGPTVLRFVAPAIAAALRDRGTASRLVVMACENAINATDLLREEIAAHLTNEERASVLERSVFANTAVDRIIPGPSTSALDVTVESYFEWVIDASPFEGETPAIPGARFVDGLDAYIERKLFTVNTGHATIAYHGFVAGAHGIAEALARDAVGTAVRAALAETTQLLVAKHDFARHEQEAYVERILTRFANPHLPDTVERVGRQPLRKLGRSERFIAPAAQLAERGVAPVALLDAIGAALRFDVPEDAESVQLRADLAAKSPERFALDVYGVDESHPLYAGLVEVTRSATA